MGGGGGKNFFGGGGERGGGGEGREDGREGVPMRGLELIMGYQSQ